MYSSQASEDAHDEEELEDSPTEAASYVDEIVYNSKRSCKTVIHHLN